MRVLVRTAHAVLPIAPNSAPAVVAVGQPVAAVRVSAYLVVYAPPAARPPTNWHPVSLARSSRMYPLTSACPTHAGSRSSSVAGCAPSDSRAPLSTGCKATVRCVCYARAAWTRRTSSVRWRTAQQRGESRCSYTSPTARGLDFAPKPSGTKHRHYAPGVLAVLTHPSTTSVFLTPAWRRNGQTALARSII
jgi:hypothetical protein